MRDVKHWLRSVVVGAIVGVLPIPLILGVTMVWDGVFDLPNPQEFMILAGLVIGIGGGALFAYAGGRWSAGRAGAQCLAHGLVVGLFAAVSDWAAITALGAELTVPILIALAARPPAGWLGGWHAARRGEVEAPRAAEA